MNSGLQPMFLIVVAALVYVQSVTDGKELDCKLGSSSCDLCRAAHPFCYWCQSKPFGEQCRPYTSETVMDLECPEHWKDRKCRSENGGEKAKLERIYKILLELKNRGKTKSPPDNVYDGDFRQEKIENGNDRYGGSNSFQNIRIPQYQENSETSRLLQTPDYYLRRARLVKALKLLKLIEVLQSKQKSNTQEGVSYTPSRENHEKVNGLDGFSDKQMKELIKATSYGQKAKNRNNQNRKVSNEVTNQDLEELLRKVNSRKALQVSAHQNPRIEKEVLHASRIIPQERTETPIPKTTVAIETTTARTFTKSATTITNREQYLEEVHVHASTRAPAVSSTTETTPVGCGILDEEDDCNNNSSCSWCNLMDTCMNRNEEDMQICYRQSKRDAIGKYVTDRCLKHLECEGCVKDGKCFWCEKTKSCHVYPFFGFVPHNCPANKWYYKDCDVQLAIFIILFPLLIILIAMIIFYFCLRYCYYRKRTLKVPLFEKPGLIEKKKGKKIYFMSGEEEDDEYRTEQIRKKYKLPVEKEPLIAP